MNTSTNLYRYYIISSRINSTYFNIFINFFNRLQSLLCKKISVPLFLMIRLSSLNHFKMLHASFIVSTFSAVGCFFGCFNSSTALGASYIGKPKSLFTYFHHDNLILPQQKRTPLICCSTHFLQIKHSRHSLYHNDRCRSHHVPAKNLHRYNVLHYNTDSAPSHNYHSDYHLPGK